jgi:hypothetical protein
VAGRLKARRAQRLVLELAKVRGEAVRAEEVRAVRV